MKYTSLKAFEKHLEGANPSHFSNVYMIISKEPFECKAATDKLTTSLLKGQPQPELCLKIFDCDSLNLNALLNEMDGFSLLFNKQIIVIQNADKLTQPARTALEPYLAKPAPSLYLIISASSINHATNFYKKAEKSGVILEVPELKPWEKERVLADWVGGQAAAAGKKIIPQACQLLVKQIGTDQHLLHNELEKLYCYIGDRNEITIKDIGAICVNVNLESIWQLGEALFKRDGGSALRISKAILSDGSSFIGLVKQIRSQFQTEFQVCSILEFGGTANDVNQRFPYMKGNILDRHVQMARGYGMKKFVTGMQLIDDIEVMAKNSVANHELLVELLIAKLVI